MSKQPKTRPSALAIISIILSVVSVGITAIALVIVIKAAHDSEFNAEYPAYQQSGSSSAETDSAHKDKQDSQSSNTPQHNPSKVISENEAKKIALDHVNLTENQVKFTKVEYEVKLRYAKYEIEFYSDAVEYEIDIDAETGKVIKYDVERAR